ncbi:MAG: sugar O-acetyltransferase, partial [Bifidobacteriales bacterium]|nr:sugar O-acetyltransferase [Bifidobacteriales bacterium]
MAMDKDSKLTSATGGAGKGNWRSQKERMLAGELYDASDPELSQLRVKAHELCRLFNASSEQE